MSTIWHAVFIADPGIYVVPGQPDASTIVTFTWDFREAGFNNELFELERVKKGMQLAELVAMERRYRYTKAGPRPSAFILTLKL